MYVFLNHDLSVLNHLGRSWLARMCDVVWQCECCRVVGRSKNMGDRKSQGQGFPYVSSNIWGSPCPLDSDGPVLAVATGTKLDLDAGDGE